MKVLVADDNLVFQTVLKSMLSNWGYEVIVANDGDEALSALLVEDGPRLAILDWVMPGMEGIDVCRQVRTASGDRYVYILILTAKTKTEDIIAAMDAGADDYVTKPFNSYELRARLRAGCRVLGLDHRLSGVAC